MLRQAAVLWARCGLRQATRTGGQIRLGQVAARGTEWMWMCGAVDHEQQQRMNGEVTSGREPFGAAEKGSNQSAAGRIVRCSRRPQFTHTPGHDHQQMCSLRASGVGGEVEAKRAFPISTPKVFGCPAELFEEHLAGCCSQSMRSGHVRSRGPAPHVCKTDTPSYERHGLYREHHAMYSVDTCIAVWKRARQIA